MKLIAASTLAALALAGAAIAQAPAAPPPLVNANADLAAPKTLKVTSPAFTEGGVIPLENSAYGASISPALKITGAPKKTRAYVVLMEDPDSQKDGLPILHWMAYDTPAELPAGLPGGASVTAPIKLMQGANVAGQPVYRGPHPQPPPKSGVHHYHVEVFALDAELAAGLGDRAALATAMKGHVLAQGELIGQFTGPQPAAN